MRAHPGWARGFLDEVWWSRVAPPDQHRWVEQDEVTRRQERACSKEDTDPKALAWYGVLVRRRQVQADQMLLRFVDGRPGSSGHHRFSGCLLPAVGLTIGQRPHPDLG